MVVKRLHCVALHSDFKCSYGVPVSLRKLSGNSVVQLAMSNAQFKSSAIRRQRTKTRCHPEFTAAKYAVVLRSRLTFVRRRTFLILSCKSWFTCKDDFLARFSFEEICYFARSYLSVIHCMLANLHMLKQCLLNFLLCMNCPCMR